MARLKMRLDIRRIKPLLISSLKEDIRTCDITTEAIIPKDLKVKAEIILKESGVIAGLEVAKYIFKLRNKNIKFKPLIKDGSFIKKIDNKKRVIARVEGNARNILEAERTALNFLSHLSGVATLTHQFVEKVKGYKVKITDTRKTTPNLRYLEKYAVRAGGGYNHRMGLYDRILIKDNHINAIRTNPSDCIKMFKRNLKRPIEVEVKKISQFKKTLLEEPDIIMLDNMNLKDIRKAVKIRNEFKRKTRNSKKIEIEVSGNVNLSTVRKIAACGVNYISIGALTHSNPALDMALKVV